MFFSAFEWMKYICTAQTKYRIHSPFVFEFVTKVLYDNTYFKPYGIIAETRKANQKNTSIVQKIDLGAGSKKNKQLPRVCDLTKKSSIPPKYGKLLYRIARYYKAQHLVELGTSIGLGTAYLAFANENHTIHSIEGCPNTLDIAKSNFTQMKLKNIQIYKGSFDALFQKILPSRLDLLYIDGNHTETATKSYFKQALPYVHNDSIMIFDDIYWSKGMKAAWTAIKEHPRVTLSIDLFRLGIVFFRLENRQKEHFKMLF